MTWTYELDSLATDPATQVRRLVGDTDRNNQLVQDEEIAFALTQRPSIYGAAAIVCRFISANLSREADTVDQNLRTTYSQRATAFAKRARDYDVQASFRSGAMPYAGGISVADKIAAENDTDRVPPNFNIGMDDNYLPVAPAGNEGQPIIVQDGDVVD